MPHESTKPIPYEQLVSPQQLRDPNTGQMVDSAELFQKLGNAENPSPEPLKPTAIQED